MADANPLSKMVPGFDFLQDLVKSAGSAMPNIGQWIAPTLNPEELEKRIEELRTVQFWLEQNARMLAATIQALEVQRMTLSTLKSMNVSMDGLRDALTIKPSAIPGFPAAVPAPAPAPEPAAPRKPARRPAAQAAAPATGPAAAAAAVDPMQWWGALTKQFTTLAAQAMKDNATDAARNLAGAMVKQSFDAAGETLKKAASVPGAVVKGAVGAAGAAAAKASAKAPARKRR